MCEYNQGTRPVPKKGTWRIDIYIDKKGTNAITPNLKESVMDVQLNVHEARGEGESMSERKDNRNILELSHVSASVTRPENNPTTGSRKSRSTRRRERCYSA